MEEDIKILQRKFLDIKKLEYVQSVRKGPGGIGVTFEILLNKEEESFEIPDFYGIEIKTKRSYSKAHITLFNAVPTGSSYYEVKRLRDNYGYPDSKNIRLKKLNAEVDSIHLTKVGLWYYFQLKVNRENEKIVLFIYDRNHEVVSSSTYWDFDILKEKLERKLQVLALVKAWSNNIAGNEYFKYYKMSIYILKEFDKFIEAIERGKIVIKFKIGSYHDKKRFGHVSSHGVGFSIKEEDLIEVFDLYR